MLKIVLLAVNAKYVHSSLAAWLIAAGAHGRAQTPGEVSVVEATIEQPNEDIADRVAAIGPDVVGVSTYIWNAEKLCGLLKLLREKMPEAVFVLGGPEASNNAEHWLAAGADYVLPGEGEYTFPAFLDDFAAAREGKTVAAPRPASRGADYVLPGEGEHTFPAFLDSFAAAREGAKPAPPPLPPSSEPIDPYTEEYFAALGDRIAYVETSRGCPFNCAFCLSAGSGARFFPTETAKRQITRLSQSGARTIKLVDRTFNCNAGRAYELFEHVIGLDTPCRFHFEVAADLFDARTISLLRTAPPGRIQLEAGLQSYSERALEAASRQADIAAAEGNIRALLEPGNIHIHVDLIAGLPFETLPEFIGGFDRAYSLGAHTLQLGFLKLLHGSELRRRAGEYGIRYSERAPYEIQSSPWLGAEDIRTLELAENALQHTHNKSRFLSALEYSLSASGLRPFEMFLGLGAAAENHGLDLPDYAEKVYAYCAKLPGVDEDELRDRMAVDWLGMVKGKNMPGFLRDPDTRRNEAHKKAIEIAQKRLGRKVRRDEAAVLLSGACIFVDSEDRDPVTGLYKVHCIK